MRANWIVALGASGLAAAALAIGLNGRHQPQILDRPDETFSVTASSTMQTMVPPAASANVATGFLPAVFTKTQSDPFRFFEPR